MNFAMNHRSLDENHGKVFFTPLCSVYSLSTFRRIFFFLIYTNRRLVCVFEAGFLSFAYSLFNFHFNPYCFFFYFCTFLKLDTRRTCDKEEQIKKTEIFFLCYCPLLEKANGDKTSIGSGILHSRKEIRNTLSITCIPKGLDFVETQGLCDCIVQKDKWERGWEEVSL